MQLPAAAAAELFALLMVIAIRSSGAERRTERRAARFIFALTYTLHSVTGDAVSARNNNIFHSMYERTFGKKFRFRFVHGIRTYYLTVWTV